MILTHLYCLVNLTDTFDSNVYAFGDVVNLNGCVFQMNF